ncbi:Cyclic nucleotide-binding protein [Gammaproteobacteria bacterium]
MSKNTKSANLVEDLGINAKQRAEILDNTRWAHDFSWSEIESLASYLRLTHVSKDAIFIKEGSGERLLAIIISGSVIIYKEDPASHPQIIATLGPGQTIGEMSMIDGNHCSATVVAAEDLTLLTMSKVSLNMLINEKPTLAVKFVLKLSRILSQRLRLTSSNLVDLFS